MRKKDEAILAGLVALQAAIDRARANGGPRTARNLEAVRDVAVAAWRAPAARRRPKPKQKAATRPATLRDALAAAR